MKNRNFFFAALLILIATSCNENQPTAAGLIEVTGCKGNEKSAELNDTPDTISCIKYEYVSENQFLRIKHINAAFNCCPGEITTDISFKNDTIIIKEKESESLCDCNCLYDLEIEVGDIPDRSFILKIIECYQSEEDELVLNIDINKEPSGEYCVTRKLYPWGI